MSHYKIVLELELEADSPLEAAKLAQEWERDVNVDLQYWVQDNSETVYSVDLAELDEEAVIEIDNYIPLIK